MKKCTITFKEENSLQNIIIYCELNNKGDLDFKLNFDPPVNKNTDLGTLSGQLAYKFCECLSK